jgi:chaperone required for assembly of F1-ATPase
MSTGSGTPPARSDRPQRPPLPKRFYKEVTVTAGEPFGVHLDGKPLRTPAKKHLLVPVRALVEAVADEWRGQAEHIDPATMPLTRLANSILDGVAGQEHAVRAEIVKYAGSDLVCYRADGPPALVQRQAEAWDPVLAWAQQALGVRFETGSGIMPVSQPASDVTAVDGALAGLDAFRLAGLHVITTLTGSALLALAHTRGHLSAEAAWAAAHVDEDWQISKWGEDTEASARRARRWAEMQAASRLLQLLS